MSLVTRRLTLQGDYRKLMNEAHRVNQYGKKDNDKERHSYP
ncbi:hypothetical protein [Secundilactobacillus collinoides]|nr:hypothetical protein [Secundilactobacillus collinoides]